MVSIPGEDDEEEQAARREEMKLEAVDALMSALNDYPPYLWGDALGAVVAALFQSKQDAEEIAQEEADKKAAEGETPPRRRKKYIRKTAPRCSAKQREADSADENISSINLTKV